MRKVLFITANPKDVEKSFSLQVAKKFIEEYKSINPNDEIQEIDVYSDYIPLIDRDILGAWEELSKGTSFDQLSQEKKEKLIRFNQLTDTFVNADKYVFVTALWNLSVPPMLKAYIDTVVVAGKTFKYTENGPIGLLEGKKAIHIQASGGVYSSGAAKAFEHGDSYLRTILGFVGIKDYESIIVEGMAYNPNNAEEIKNSAIENAIESARKF